MKKITKTLSSILIACLLFGSFSVMAGETEVLYEEEQIAFDENSGEELYVLPSEDEPELYEIEEIGFDEEFEETIEDYVSLQSNTSGTVGKAGTWVYEDGTLVISGAGDMDGWFSFDETTQSYVVDATPWSHLNSEITKVVIHDGITSVGMYAFAGCTNLTTVILPETVYHILKDAFSRCSRLATVEYGWYERNLINIDIADGNEPLTNATWHFLENEQKCGYKAFWTLENGVLTISGEGRIDDYSIGEAIPWYSDKDSITSVVIDGNITGIGNMAFSDCGNLTSVTFVAKGITSIGDGAFMGCTSLAEIEIPDSVQSIEMRAFRDCTSMKHAVLPSGLTEISPMLFYQCESLEDVNIPETVTEIGFQAFACCESLKELVLPNTVTKIGEGAVGACKSLTSFTIPSGVTEIARDTFDWCTSLTSIVIPEGVTTIGSSAFYGCEGLESIQLPSTLTYIDEFAFHWCIGLKSVSIPEGITVIRFSDFCDNHSLETVYLPSTLKTIEQQAFSSCNELKDVYFAGTIADWKQIEIDGVNKRYLDNASIHCSDGDVDHNSDEVDDVDTSLNLVSNINTRAYIQIPDGEDPSSYSVNVTYHSKYQNINRTQSFTDLRYYPNTDEYLVDALYAGSDEMTDIATLTIYKDGTAVRTEELSVRSMAETKLLDENRSESEKTLYRALLQYGHYAQLTFGTNTDNLPGTTGAPALVPIPASYAPNGDPTSMANYISNFECGLALDSSVDMNVYIKPASGYSLNDFIISVTDKNGAPASHTTPVMKNGEIYFKVTGIYSDQMIDDYNITVSLKNDATKVGTWNRSLITCAYDLQQKGRYVNLVQAMYQYSLAAVEVFQ